jgi:hypothetical protein
MAKFLGRVQGRRGAATRLGDRDLTVTAASWEGAIVVELSERDGKIWAHVGTTSWHGHGENQLIYSGPIDATIVPAGIRTELEIHPESK